MVNQLLSHMEGDVSGGNHEHNYIGKVVTTIRNQSRKLSSLFVISFSLCFLGNFPWFLITILELFLLLNSWHIKVELLFHEHQFRFISFSTITSSFIIKAELISKPVSNSI
ncbi:unnamed protein product [Brassica rapa]|uniref:BnaA09g10650D protein n=2 Tax=Brassica TaxID=3705 RepID=A0A078HST4_BRANA|nr:unnamed protein product [Brassica rapa]CDY39813.1 BnaA09g10650D [Brassica napus]VDC59360.1 unnamed protein product [Brassica rapa]